MNLAANGPFYDGLSLLPYNQLALPFHRRKTMKRIRELCAAATLIFVLSLSALAGEIHTNAVPPPPTPPASATATQPDDATTDVTKSANEYETLITEITLSFLKLLSVL